MTPEEQSRQWHEDSEPTFVHIAHWRQAHPQATMAEIEEAVDAQMHILRAHLLQEGAQAAPIPPPAESADAQKPRCPDCKVVLQARGQRERHLKTHGGQTISLKRTYLSCPRCGYGVFPPG